MRRFSGLARYAVVLLVIVSAQFFLFRAMPGDPLIHVLGEEGYLLASMNPEEMARLRVEYGLDKPLPLQFASYLWETVHGRLGWSSTWNMPVFKIIMDRLPWTLLLMFPSIMLSVFFSALLGTWAGWTNDSLPQKWVSGFFLLLYSFPGYCLALLLVAALGFGCAIFPTGGMVPLGNPGQGFSLLDAARHMALPVLSLALSGTAYKFLVMKSAVMDITDQEYVLTAVAKGLSPFRVAVFHVFPNALPQLIHLAAMSLGHMVSGALLIEVVFSWNGMGVLMHEAVMTRDYPLLMGSFLVLTFCVMLANALADLLHKAVDPRVRDGAYGA
ncbi:ABC transporter permease [Desulfatibacillum aliphaticivorans]|uniref:ABC transporter permease n=1 Tax=Desulfatibacillum aliphaticivorans TaxID=218208 RepID=UPI00041A4008|nr:ABC transporter permease [Desulfatibacillum aliphaticivorans]